MVFQSLRLVLVECPIGRRGHSTPPMGFSTEPPFRRRRRPRQREQLNVFIESPGLVSFPRMAGYKCRYVFPVGSVWWDVVVAGEEVVWVPLLFELD